MTSEPEAIEAVAIGRDGHVVPAERTAGRERWWIALTALLHMLVFAPVVINALFRPRFMFANLWLWHAARIPETFRDPLSPIQPHFGWPLVGRGIDLVIPGTDPRFGGSITSILASAGFGVALFWVLRHDDDGSPLLKAPFAVAGSLVIALLESPAALQGSDALGRAETRFVPLYYSFVPTTLAAMGLNVALVWSAALLVRGRLGTRGRRWLPALVIATAIAKPNLVPSLAVVAPLWAVALDPVGGRAGWRTSPRLREALLLVSLPAAAVTALQYAILQWFSPSFLKGGLEIRPFWELGELGGFGWQFWLLLALPAVALVLLRGRLLADVALSMSIGLFVVGLAATLLLARSGETYYQGAVGGDVLQLAGAGATMVLIFTIRRLVVLCHHAELPRSVALVCVAVLVPYMLAGASSWRCQAGLAECYPGSIPPIWPQPGIDERVPAAAP